MADGLHSGLYSKQANDHDKLTFGDDKNVDRSSCSYNNNNDSNKNNDNNDIDENNNDNNDIANKNSLEPLNKDMKDIKGQKGIDASMFKSCFCKDNIDFLSHTQQDALEFFIYFLTKIESLSKQNKNLKIINKIFQCSSETRIKCVKCNRVSYRNDPCQFLSMPIPQPNSNSNSNINSNSEREQKPNINKIIDSFFDEELISGYNCANCKEETDITK